jgi:hypothetical protein
MTVWPFIIGQVSEMRASMYARALLVAGSSLFLTALCGSGSGAQPAPDEPASFTASLAKGTPAALANSHTIYVPAYSSIRLGSIERGVVDLATTLSIHNISEDRPLTILRADYFDTSGNLIRHYVPEPITILPLGTVEAFVPVQDTRGGTGANFIVEWAAAQPTIEPLVEAIMIGTEGTKGFTFTSRGVNASSLKPQ